MGNGAVLSPVTLRLRELKRSARDGPVGASREEVPERAGPSRSLILEALRAAPGITRSEVVARTGLSAGSVVHHLARLVADGAVRDARYGKRTIYCLPADDGRQSLARSLRDDRLRPILERIRATPGLRRTDIVADVSPRELQRRLRFLVAAGIVVRDGERLSSYTLQGLGGLDVSLAPAGDTDGWLEQASARPAGRSAPPWAALERPART